MPPILVEFMAARRLLGQGAKAAGLLGVRHQTFYGWLSGQHVPPATVAERLAKRLKRPDLVGLIARDREAHRRRMRRLERQAATGAA